MWKYMVHPHVLPLLGVTAHPFQLISNWMSGGNLPRYINDHPNADRLGLVKVPDIVCVPRLRWFQLHGVAKGLSYLHTCNVIHGDLKGVRDFSNSLLTTTLIPSKPNVLVDNFGQTRIADFGFAAVTLNPDSVARSPTLNQGHTPRWTAPEILRGAECSQEGDIFSFAMVMVEVRHGRSVIGTVLASYW